MSAPHRTQSWESTKIPNLFKLKESGIYYGRVKPKGSTQLRKSLETSNFSVAREKLRDWMLSLQVVKAGAGGTWGAVIEHYLSWLNGQKVRGDITDSTIDYKKELLDTIRNTWDGFDRFNLGDVTERGLREWQVKHRARYSATRTNGATTALREMMDVAVSQGMMTREVAAGAKLGLVYVKVVYDYKRMTMQLPEPAQLAALRNEVYTRCQKKGTLGGWLFDFLLFSGCRIASAGAVLWEDVLWNANVKGKLYFRAAKYGPYEIPLFQELRDLLERLKVQYPNAGPTDKVLPTVSAKTVLTSACKALNIAHLSHHDLRHVFATRCIEKGVDIPTVAAWLGHKDNGRTVMLVYGHLRQEHSQAQAADMKFL